MKQLKYVGPHGGGVDVYCPDGRIVRVEPGGVLETSDEHADSLLAEQGNWKLEKSAKAGKEA